MDSESRPPKRRQTAPSNHRIPPNILEEILLNLPVKSLLRFRCVSKSWKSTISESWFIRKHRSRATHKRLFMISPTLLNERLFMTSYQRHSLIQTATFSSTNINTQPIVNDMRDYISLFVQLKAFCNELWCVEVGKLSMYLWNPFTLTYKKLPHPMHVSSSSSLSIDDAAYGIGYDAVNDDFKLLKIWRSCALYQGTSLYSLRSDSWRETRQYFPREYPIPRRSGVFVNGAFHWMVLWRIGQKPSAIISFDLSTERYKEVPQPVYSPVLNRTDLVEVTVLREMLCVWLNYRNGDVIDVFVLWAMKDYGVEKSWTKMYDIRSDSIPLIQPTFGIVKLINVKPLYVYENGEILIWVLTSLMGAKIVIYKDEQVIAHQEIAHHCTITDEFHGGFVCIESLISPAMWPLIDKTMKHRR